MILISITSWLAGLDWALFTWINSTLQNGFFDLVLPWVREPLVWLPLYAFVIAIIFFNAGNRAWLMVFFLVLTASVCDFSSSSVLKPLVKRTRPCNDTDRYDHLTLRVACGSGYSFPSSHATNHAGMAVFLFLLFKNVFRKGRYLFLLWAIIISFAQVYVGVHYPFDVLIGWGLGVVIAILMIIGLRLYLNYFFKNDKTIGDLKHI